MLMPWISVVNSAEGQDKPIFSIFLNMASASLLGIRSLRSNKKVRVAFVTTKCRELAIIISKTNFLCRREFDAILALPNII